MIKVIEAISDTNIGGAGILLENRLSHTNKKIFDTTVIIPKNSMLRDRLRKIGAKVLEIDSGKDKSLDLKSILEYLCILKKVKPDIINSHGSLSSRIAAYIFGVPVRIYTRHCVFPTHPIYKFNLPKRFFSLITNSLSHGIIAVSPSAKDNLLAMGVKEQRIAVIINGSKKLEKLDVSKRKRIREELGISNDKIVITICARLEKCKDHVCFIKAAYLLNKRSNKYVFMIIGSGREEEKLKKLSQKMNLCDKIIFTGFVNDVTKYMNITDINVNCSIGTETSSLALSEGMSLGIPSVVSDYGGNPYMVKNNINGYVYKRSDYRDLASKIEKVALKENYKRLSKNSKLRFLNELNSKQMNKKVQTFYINLHKKLKVKPKGKHTPI